MRKAFRKCYQKGFTLIELIVAVAVVALALGLAAPSYEVFVVSSRMSGSVNELQGAIAYARSEAVKKQTTVTMCSSLDSATCANTAQWTNGWLIFTDRDSDATLDATDTIARVGNQQEGGSSVRLEGFSYGAGVIQFNAEGMLRGGNAVSGSVIVCPNDNEEQDAKAVVLYTSGFSRLAVDEDNPGNNVVELHTGNDVTCP